MNIHDRIKQLQNERNWTINHMAVESDLSPATVVNWFKRNATPTLDGIQKLCVAFGISLSEFFNESTNPVYLNDNQLELQKEWDLMHKNEKSAFLETIKAININRRNSNPL